MRRSFSSSMKERAYRTTRLKMGLFFRTTKSTPQSTANAVSNAPDTSIYAVGNIKNSKPRPPDNSMTPSLRDPGQISRAEKPGLIPEFRLFNPRIRGPEREGPPPRFLQHGGCKQVPGRQDSAAQ